MYRVPPRGVVPELGSPPARLEPCRPEHFCCAEGACWNGARAVPPLPAHDHWPPDHQPVLGLRLPCGGRTPASPVLPRNLAPGYPGTTLLPRAKSPVLFKESGDWFVRCGLSPAPGWEKSSLKKPASKSFLPVQRACRAGLLDEGRTADQVKVAEAQWRASQRGRCRMRLLRHL